MISGCFSSHRGAYRGLGLDPARFELGDDVIVDVEETLRSPAQAAAAAAGRAIGLINYPVMLAISFTYGLSAIHRLFPSEAGAQIGSRTNPSAGLSGSVKSWTTHGVTFLL